MPTKKLVSPSRTPEARLIAEKLGASFESDDAAGALALLDQEWRAAGCPEPKRWLRVRLRDYFPSAGRPPRWVEPSPGYWPFEGDKPMVFLGQMTVPNGPVASSMAAPGEELYVFGARRMCGGDAWEMVYRVLSQESDLERTEPAPKIRRRKSARSSSLKGVSREWLHKLFEHLDRQSASGLKCRHDFRLTRKFLARHEIDAIPYLEWLGSHGAGCDCEVVLNVAPEWGPLVGVP